MSFVIYSNHTIQFTNLVAVTDVLLTQRGGTMMGGSLFRDRCYLINRCSFANLISLEHPTFLLF